MPEELWAAVHNTGQEAAKKTIPPEKESRKAEWPSEGDSQIAEERREAKCKAERERHVQLNAKFRRIASRDKKAFFHEQCIKIEETNIRRKTRTFFRKIGNSKGTFHPKMGTIKDRECRDLVQKRS